MAQNTMDVKANTLPVAFSQVLDVYLMFQRKSKLSSGAKRKPYDCCWQLFLPMDMSYWRKCLALERQPLPKAWLNLLIWPLAGSSLLLIWCRQISLASLFTGSTVDNSNTFKALFLQISFLPMRLIEQARAPSLHCLRQWRKGR